MSLKEILIDKAVQLWIEALNEPQSDMGADSFAAFVCRSLDLKRKHDILEESGIQEKIKHFGVCLKRILENSEEVWLSTDYSPSGDLAQAAEESKLPFSLFPIKSVVYTTDKSVVFSFGYGKEDTYLFPQEDGSWVSKRRG